MKQLSALSASSMNKEKTIFFVASILFLYAGFLYQDIPSVRSWSAARAERLPKNISPLDLSEPPPVGEFLVGSRSSPFTEQTSRPEVKRDRLLSWSRKTTPRPATMMVAEKPVVKKPSGEVPPPPPPPPGSSREDVDPGGRQVARADKYEVPVRWAGHVQVGGGDKRAMFISEEDGQHHAVRTGEEIPGTDLTVVLITKNIVIVRNKKGERFRLDDILKASSGRSDELE